VVIPTRDRPQLLRRAVASAAGLDVIVVDDASGPPARAAAELLAADGAIRYLRLERNSGPAVARNLGVRHAGCDLVLFLDDDDAILPGGVDRLLAVAEEHPAAELYLHNCEWSDGSTSLPRGDGAWRVGYGDWLRGRLDLELKPVVRRTLFDRARFDDTGAGGEGLLWGRVIRERGAIVSATPVVLYDTTGSERLTEPRELVRRSAANAAVADLWLREFGADVLAVDRDRYRTRLGAAVVYNLLAGRRRRAGRHLRTAWRALPPRDRALFSALLALPAPVARALFLASRSGRGARAASASPRPTSSSGA